MLSAVMGLGTEPALGGWREPSSDWGHLKSLSEVMRLKLGPKFHHQRMALPVSSNRRCQDKNERKSMAC